MKLPAGVSKTKFDAVIRNLLSTPPMPLSSISPKKSPATKRAK
jgi:hypothetical protein